MGKYMKKSKITGEVTVMEVAPQLSLGVRTRARTLALQRLQKTAANTELPSSPAAAQNIDFSYLQLRSRRLEKSLPSIPAKPKRRQQQKENCGEDQNPNPNPDSNPKASSGVNSGSVGCGRKSEEDFLFGKMKGETEDLEASFGENNLDLEDRSARETTPSSLIRDIDGIGTPASTTRRTSSTAINCRVLDAMQRTIPTTEEIEEFFSSFAEQQQQRLFIEKYNFDVNNDVPLSGRYDWVKISP